MHWKSVCLLLAVGLNYVAGQVDVQITVAGSKNAAGASENCRKYLEKGNQKLHVAWLRVLQLDEKGKITANFICDYGGNNVKTDAPKRCASTGTLSNSERFAVLLGVTAKAPMMASQIEYRYKESTFNLFKNKIVDKATLEGQHFEHDVHIMIPHIMITFNGKAKSKLTVGNGNCHANWPGSLIGDHGLYVMRIEKGTPQPAEWQRMHFDPPGLGEYVLY